MSRSYKKTPIAKDNGSHTKFAKRQSASRARNIPVESEDSEVIASSRSAFKKIFHDTYDIHDYVDRWSREEAIIWYNAHKDEDSPAGRGLEDYKDLNDFLRYWEKCMIRK